ncbi:unnamed protein product [Musa acuminata subsp. malaccensis]|uniref:(wild Malaysian banana) hypothetical protein n=1 Tax=Musa acuminata subsp. malaccensis TaxID=214687 RepID=A0A804IPK4_MUSAM|nr:unnamed protein product [Musa acuminata subsp. malaccensis]
MYLSTSLIPTYLSPHFDSFEAPPVSPHPFLGTSTWRLSLLIVAANNLIRGFLRRRISQVRRRVEIPSCFFG